MEITYHALVLKIIVTGQNAGNEDLFYFFPLLLHTGSSSCAGERNAS
jgi:hypothetical protein